MDGAGLLVDIYAAPRHDYQFASSAVLMNSALTIGTAFDTQQQGHYPSKTSMDSDLVASPSTVLQRRLGHLIVIAISATQAELPNDDVTESGYSLATSPEGSVNAFTLGIRGESAPGRFGQHRSTGLHASLHRQLHARLQHQNRRSERFQIRSVTVWKLQPASWTIAPKFMPLGRSDLRRQDIKLGITGVSAGRSLVRAPSGSRPRGVQRDNRHAWGFGLNLKLGGAPTDREQLVNANVFRAF